MMWSIIFSGVKAFLGPVLNFFNARVSAEERMHISDNAAAVGALGAVEGAITKADELNTQVRLKEGKWSPWVLVTIGGFMVPFAWHTWQVVLDSSRFHISFGAYFLPHITEHVVGSWKVAALPGLFETTEHAVIQSLFVGASAAVAAIPIIRALRRR